MIPAGTIPGETRRPRPKRSDQAPRIGRQDRTHPTGWKNTLASTSMRVSHLSLRAHRQIDGFDQRSAKSCHKQDDKNAFHQLLEQSG